MTMPWRFQTRFSVVALSSNVSRSGVNPASLGEMVSQSVPGAEIARIDGAMRMAPMPTRNWRRLGFGSLTSLGFLISATARPARASAFHHSVQHRGYRLDRFTPPVDHGDVAPDVGDDLVEAALLGQPRQPVQMRDPPVQL